MPAITSRLRPPLSPSDRLLASIDHGLRTVLATPASARPSPAMNLPPQRLTAEQARLAGALMRVNHVGEICAQALYQSQALVCGNADLRAHFVTAAQEELDHLAWSRQRLDDLGDRPSLLAPLWYGGAFSIGCLAGLAGDRVSLGFVVETERQVEQHLAEHLERLPSEDLASRAVVAEMKADEARHAEEALAAGAQILPVFARSLMRFAARIMTRTAHHL
jgi:ubiquinone biosynthesis monooxygenase Coq7